MTRKLSIKLISSVKRDRLQRLAARLSSSRVDARVEYAMAPERWRELRAQGRLAHLWGRLEGSARFPLQVVVDAMVGDSEVLITTANPPLLSRLLVAGRHLHGRTVIAVVDELLEGVDYGSLFAGADGIVFAGDRLAEHAMRRFGAPARHAVLPTGVEVAAFSPDALGASGPESELERWCDRHVVALCSSDATDESEDWATLAEAGAEYVARYGAARGEGKPLVFLVAGAGPEVDGLRQAWAGMPTERVRFEPRLSQRAHDRVLARAAIVVATREPTSRLEPLSPGVQAAMAAGSALVTAAPRDSDLGDLVTRHSLGIRVDPGDHRALVDALRRYVTKPRARQAAARRAKSVAREHYDMPRLAGQWRTFIDQVRSERSRFRRPSRAKRGLDLLGAGVGLALTAPLMLGAAAAVRATMGSPVLFEQRRPGLFGKPFSMMKFRTMRAPRPGEEGPDADAARLTKVGAFLRKTSIDELPTLLNVLRGDLSLVGPRPLLMRYLERYDAEQARRHDVPPGVTGWAQINGRNALSWPEKFSHDVWYVDNTTFWRDLGILARTLKKVVVRDGISSAGHVTMPEFTGAEETRDDDGVVIDLTARAGESSGA